MKYFSHYVSLGRNCEVAYQFRRLLGKDSSSFFSWNITDFSALQSILESKFENILEPINFERFGNGDLIFEVSHGFCFHSPFSTPTPSEDPNYIESLAKLRDKTKYLVDKFFRVAKHAELTAYFYKTHELDSRRKACRVRDLLDVFHGGKDNFVLIIIQHVDRNEADWKELRIANRYVRRFAPDNDASDGHVQSYDKLFIEFPINKPIRLAGF